MSWSRFDDAWFRSMNQLGLNVTEIGYLMGLIQHCSLTNAEDGLITAFTARTIAEVENVDAILTHLGGTGQIIWDGKTCVVLHLADHLPSDAVKNRSAFNRDRKRRQRAHNAGDHSLCTSSTCEIPVTCDTGATGCDTVNQSNGRSDVACDVAGWDVGTGQDGPGRRDLPSTAGTREEATSPRPGFPGPGGVDLTTGELTGPCTWCSGGPGGCIQCRPELFEMDESA